jgi:hypothetical protein
MSLAQDAKPALDALVEFDLATSVQVKNPFDPAQIDLVVNYTAPDGKVMTIPAFWYQAYDPTGAAPCGDPGWKARLTPTRPGKWTAQAEIRKLKVKSASVSFQVAQADARGFVRVNAKNPRYLAFDNGATYFPIGLNIGWWKSDPLGDYQRWMDKLHANGGSLIRVWMASWSFGIEWQDTGLGDYTKRERQAWLLDQVFNMANQRDMTIDLVLLNHGAFSQTTNPEWDANPYNVANGGMCQTPDCFATNPQAQDYFKRRLRYIAARWGYSPNLLAWEWWNEEDLTPIKEDDLAAWVKKMTVTLRSYDPYQHLINISFAGNNSKKVLSLPEISFSQVHLYDFRDPTQTFSDIYHDMSLLAPNKPILFGEFGFSAAIEDAKSYDKTGAHLHNGEWMAAFTGFASSTMYWWWDSYIDPLNLWSQFSSLSRFLHGEDLATFTPGKATLSNPLVASALTLQNNTLALIWVKNNRYEAAVTDAMLGQPVHGLELTLSGLKDGSYQVTWYDPIAAKWLDTAQATAQNGKLKGVVPDFLKDMAARVTAP